MAVLVAIVPDDVFCQFSPVRHEYVEYIVTLDHSDRTYKVGESPEIKIQAAKGGIPLDGVAVAYSCGDEMFVPALADSVIFKDGTALIKMGKCTVPGFRECNFSFTVNDRKYDDVVKVGFSPEQITPYTVMPSDFKEFWDGELLKVGKVDFDPRLTLMKKYSDEQVNVYLVRLTVGEGGRYFYGYLSKPNDNLPHPVMFSPPGAGPYKRWPQTEFARKGFIVLNVDIHGLSPESSDVLIEERSPDIYGYWGRGITSRDSCYFREVYAGCSRCIDYLCSLPGWNGNDVVVMDGSQGGALSIVTAALNKKVTLACVFYPALCDLKGFANGRAGGWPKYFRDVPVDDDSKEKVSNSLDYYDVVNFARILDVPLYCSFGYNDDVCSPTSIFGMLNSVKSPKTIHCTYTNSHFNFGESNKLATDWVVEQVYDVK